MRARSASLMCLLVLGASFLTGCGGGSGGGATAGAFGFLSGGVLGFPAPVSGARVRIEPLGIETRTSSDGFWRIDDVPIGTYTVIVDGSEVFDPNDNSAFLPPMATFEFPGVVVGVGGTVLNARPVFLPTLESGLQIDTGGTTTATLNAGTTIGDSEMGAFLVFEQSTTVTFMDSKRTTVSLSEVPMSGIPAGLPSGKAAGGVFTVQPLGATFSPPAKVVFPNWNKLPPGTTGVELNQFDPDLGVWTVFGTGTVDTNGETVVSDPGSGLAEAGLAGPIIPSICTTTVTGRVVDAGAPTNGVADIQCITINGLSVTTDASGNFTISDVPIPRADLQVDVSAAPLAANSGFEPGVSTRVIVVCNGVTNVGDIPLQPQAVDTTAPTVTGITPPNGAMGVAENASIQVTLSENVSPGSIEYESFTVDCGTGPVPGILAVNGNLVTFIPLTAMPLSSACTVTITTAVEDEAGNYLAAAFTSSFNTAAAASGGTASVTITGPGTVQQGQQIQLAGEVRDAAGALIVGAQSYWSTSDPSIVSISSTGFATGVNMGGATITATSGDVSDTWVVSVNAPPVNAVAVKFASQTMVVGSLTQFSAEAEDAASSPLPGVPFAWMSSNPAVATVDGVGSVVALAAGTATITASAQGFTGAAQVTVLAATSISWVRVTPIATNFEVGLARQFFAEAHDSFGRLIPGVAFSWTSSDPTVATVDPNLGLATSVAPGSTTITASVGGVQGTATLSVDQNSQLTVLVTGAIRVNDPLPNVRILHQDPTTGAVLGDMTTDANGVAAFGDIGNTRTTVTLVFDNGFGEITLLTLRDIPTGTIPVVVDAEVFVAATFDLTLDNISPQADIGKAFIGDFVEGKDYDETVVGGTAALTGVEVPHLQPDARFSVLTRAGNDATGETLGYGFALDLAPSAVNGGTLFVDTGSPPITIPFTATQAVYSDGFILQRRGALFDVFGFGADAVTSGTVAACELPGTEAWNFLFQSPQTPTTAALGVELLYRDNLPSSLTVIVPDITIDNLARNAATQTVSWTAGGADLPGLDIADLEMQWFGPAGEELEWIIFSDLATGSIALPQVPTDLMPLMPPASGVGFFVDLVGLDNVTGFDQAVRRAESVYGNLNEVFFTANSATAAERGSTAVIVDVEGFGTGRVVSTPPGIDTDVGQFTWNWPTGTEVTLTATPDPGFVITQFECEGPVQGDPTIQQTCTFETDNELVIVVEVNFN